MKIYDENNLVSKKNLSTVRALIIRYLQNVII